MGRRLQRCRVAAFLLVLRLRFSGFGSPASVLRLRHAAVGSLSSCGSLGPQPIGVSLCLIAVGRGGLLRAFGRRSCHGMRQRVCPSRTFSSMAPSHTSRPPDRRPQPAHFPCAGNRHLRVAENWWHRAVSGNHIWPLIARVLSRSKCHPTSEVMNNDRYRYFHCQNEKVWLEAI